MALPVYDGGQAGLIQRQIAQQSVGGRLLGAIGAAARPSSSSPTVAGTNAADNYSLHYEGSMDRYLAEVARLMGMGLDAGTASALASGGSGGGGGGGSYVVDNSAARNAALANSASTYASAAATFDASPENYRRISGDERTTGSDATMAAKQGVDQAANNALATIALQRKALGIEDAANVTRNTVANEQAIADQNIDANDARMAARTQGHLDNNLQFNTDLKAIVELEGKEKQKQITDYYANQLAQIAARSRGGSSGGGSRSSSSSSKSLTAGQLWSAARDLMNDDIRRNYSMDAGGYNQRAFQNAQALYPDASFGNQLKYAQYAFPQLFKKG